MLARVFSCAVIGLEGVIVEVEVDFGQGLPHMAIVGLPDAAVQESRERVFSAIKKLTPNFVQFHKLPASKLQGVVTRVEM